MILVMTQFYSVPAPLPFEGTLKIADKWEAQHGRRCPETRTDRDGTSLVEPS